MARPLADRFTKLKDDLEAGRVPLDRSSEKSLVLSLLKTLEIPATSQMLFFSTTSLQLSRISPRNPRALYFSDDLYLGYVPGGRIEVVSLDPELGGIFYIFDIPKNEQPLRIERSDRCMNCHAGEETRRLPGLLIKSVVPGPTGGSLDAFRLEQTGHGIPFDQRFGGWYVTGQGRLTNHWGNLTGKLSAQGLTKYPVEPGTQFDFERYPVSSSDLLPQLVHEHQVGFVNRTVEASYRARSYWHADNGRLSATHAEELDKQARELIRYLLFADEVPLPPGGIEGDVGFRADFLRGRRQAANGSSLRDFDLHTRLFKHRCSFMIYSAVFQGLPKAMKERACRRLGEALRAENPDPEFAYLPSAEKAALRTILKETLNDLPSDW